jgi:nitric oxide synthase-interacting protein
MGKHSKQAGGMGSEAPTYAERRAMGHGTAKERLGKDSVGNFFDCRLTLSPASDPVACPSGFLFSREAIVENLLAQKKAVKRKLAAWQAQQAASQGKAAELAAVEQEAALLAFDRQTNGGASGAAAARLREAVAEEAAALLADKRTATSAVNIRVNAARMAEMNAFWLPSKTPEAAALLDKPDAATTCPATGKKLKLRDLVDVKFTRVPGGGPNDYMDPVTRDLLTNASRLLLLRPTGDVVLEATWRTCIRPEGRYGGAEVGDADVLELQRGGTGFAGHDGEAAQAQKFFALGPGSGLADRRGQNASAGSKFGLRQMN